MLKPQFLLPLADELVVDLFAGGGGASTAGGSHCSSTRSQTRSQTPARRSIRSMESAPSR